MGEITVRINVPEDVLKVVDLDEIVKRVEREIMLEYRLRKLHGKLRGRNLSKLLEEVEEERGT